MTLKFAYKLLLFVALFSTIETSQAQTVFGRNLVVNGDAESGPGDPDGRTPVTSIPG